MLEQCPRTAHCSAPWGRPGDRVAGAGAPLLMPNWAACTSLPPSPTVYRSQGRPPIPAQQNHNMETIRDPLGVVRALHASRTTDDDREFGVKERFEALVADPVLLAQASIQTAWAAGRTPAASRAGLAAGHRDQASRRAPPSHPPPPPPPPQVPILTEATAEQLPNQCLVRFRGMVSLGRRAAAAGHGPPPPHRRNPPTPSGRLLLPAGGRHAQPRVLYGRVPPPRRHLGHSQVC